MAIEMSKFMSENIKEEKPLTIKRNAKVRNMFECRAEDPNKEFARLISKMLGPISRTGLIAKMVSNQQRYINNGGAIAIDRVNRLNGDDYFHL